MAPAVEPMGERSPSVEVLVTGFGSFGTHERNPSFEIVSRLPDSITDGDSRTPDIILHKHPAPVKVAYRHVTQLVPELYDSLPNVRFFVHVGVHGRISKCRIEKRARKGPYDKLDVDGRRLTEHPEDRGEGWEDGPDEMTSAVDICGIVERMAAEGKWDIEESNDTGLYLCEFIYYSSLLTARRFEHEGRGLKGIFVHVPPNLDSETLDKQRDTIAQAIREMVREG